MKQNIPQPLIIKKYENRRLYNTLTSQYINQDQVAQLVRDGHEVRVVDAATGRDLTRLVLAQIVLEDAKTARFPFSSRRVAADDPCFRKGNPGKLIAVHEGDDGHVPECFPCLAVADESFRVPTGALGQASGRKVDRSEARSRSKDFPGGLRTPAKASEAGRTQAANRRAGILVDQTCAKKAQSQGEISPQGLTHCGKEASLFLSATESGWNRLCPSQGAAP